jgi:FkbM family methyltransferase
MKSLSPLDRFKLSLPDVIKRITARFGISISSLSNVSEYRLVADSIKRNNVDLLIDLGANRGQFAIGVRACGYRGPLVSFEPDSVIFKKLEAAAKSDKQWETLNLAVIDSEDETMSFNVSSNLGYSSSLLSFSSNANRFYPRLETSKKITVNCISLKNVLKKYDFATSVFIKADIQGFEKQLFSFFDLKNSKNVSGVMIEISLTLIYEGEWSVLECLTYFELQGFNLIAVSPEDYSEKFGNPQVNLYFERSPIKKEPVV